VKPLLALPPRAALFAALFVALLAALFAARPARAGERAYVVASDQPAFTEAARAAVEAIGSDAELLRADESAKASLASATVVVAVGPLAARLVVGAMPVKSRLVACLTPRAAAERAVAVPLQASPQDVFAIVRQVIPTARKLGVFPAPGRADADLFDAARANGIQIELPRSGEPFTAAVDRLLGVTDAIWIDDIQSIPNGGAALIVKKASEQRKLVIGPNRATVLQGAFFAVVPDPAAHGRAAGEAALHLLKGDDVRAVPPPLGRVVINGALAKAFQTKLTPMLARRSETVE
jgi:hypothetical protein